MEAGGPCFTVSSEVMAPNKGLQMDSERLQECARTLLPAEMNTERFGKIRKDGLMVRCPRTTFAGYVKHIFKYYLGLPGHSMVFSPQKVWKLDFNGFKFDFRPCLGDEDQVKSSSSHRTSSKVVLCMLKHFEHAETFSLTT